MTTYTSQPDETSGVDTRLVSDEATLTHNDGILGIGQTGATIDRSLLKFDLSSIPAYASIVSATLSLWTKTDYSTNARDVKVYRVLRNWVETQATWNVYSTGNNWGTAGCGNSTTDYDGANIWASTNVSASVPNNTEVQWVFTATGLAELKKVINGTYSNYGMLLKADTESADFYYYYSSADATSGYRPKLVIEYTVGGQVIIWSSE